MFLRFIDLQWKAFFRSSGLGKSLGLKVLMGFLAIYFAVIFLLLGIGLYPLLQDLHPDEVPLLVANQYILIWFIFELIVRFMLQALPIISVKPLLITPIPKRKIVNYVLGKSLFSFFNLLPLLVIVPFGLFTLYKGDLPLSSVLAWMCSVFALDLCVNYINFLLKKKFSEELKDLIPYFIVFLVLAFLDYLKIWSITEAFGTGLNHLVLNPSFSAIPFIILFVVFKWNQRVLEKRFFLDGSLRGRVEEVNTQDFQWTRRFGDIAPFLQLDLKLIWRNKRPRTVIFLSLILMFYGLIFYPEQIYHNMPAIFVFVGIFMTGIFMINFGQFIPSWDASYYSMMMAQNIPLRKYLASKAGLLAFSVIVLTVLATPYLYYGWKILVINLCCALYNIGVNVPIILYAGSFNRKRIDLEKSQFMNYQGTGATQWLIALPLMIIPVLLFWATHSFFGFEVGAAVLACLGIIGVGLREYLMDHIEQAYFRNKYSMINGFKQTGE